MVHVAPNKNSEYPFKIDDVTLYTNMVIVRFSVTECAKDRVRHYRAQIGTDCVLHAVETETNSRVYHQSLKLDDREKAILSRMDNTASREEKRFLFYADKISRTFRSIVIILGFMDSSLYKAMNSKDGVNANVRNITYALIQLLKENEIGD